MRFFLIFSLLLIVLGCGSSPEKEAESLFNKAVEQIDNYKFEAARLNLSKLSELKPGSPESYFGSGLILEKELQYYDALHVYMTITNSVPSFALAHAGCWRFFTHLEEYADALDAALAYNELLPYDPESKLLLAESFMNMDMPIRAQRFLDTALTLGSNQSLVDMIRARAYALDHTMDSAKVMYEHALASASNSPRVYLEAAAYLEATGLIDSAVVMSRKAVELSDGDSHTQLMHFSLALRLKYFYEAHNVITQLETEKVPGLMLAMMKTFYYNAKKDYTPARHAMTEVEHLANNSLTFWLLDMLVRAPVGDDLTLTSNSDVIASELSKDKFDREFADYMWYYTAMVFTQFMDDMVGDDKLSRVAPGLARRAPGELRITFVKYRTGQQKEFDRRVDLIERAHRRQADWLTGLADIFANRFVRRYDEAGEHYEKALLVNQWYRPAFENDIAMNRRLKKYSDAVMIFDKYPHFAQQYPELRLLQAICLAENGKTTEGSELFFNNVGSLKGNLTWFSELHSILAHQDKSNEIVRLGEWLLEKNSQNPDAQILAAGFLAGEKEFDKAKLAVEAAQAMEPDDLTARALQAWVRYNHGETQAAIDILKKNIDEQIYHIESNFYLSRILATEGLESRQAENSARKAVFDSKSSLWTWMNLSYVYFQIGRYDLSRGEALKASHKYTDEPEPVFRLGMALYMEGKDDAREKLQEAIDMGLRGDNLTEALATLNKL